MEVNGKTVQLIGRDPFGVGLLVLGRGARITADSESELYVHVSGGLFEPVATIYKGMFGGFISFHGLRVKEGPYQGYLLSRFPDAEGENHQAVQVWGFGRGVGAGEQEPVQVFDPEQFRFEIVPEGVRVL